MGSDRCVDIQGEGESGASIFGGDDGRRAGADAFEKGFNLEAERLAGFHGRFLDAEARKPGNGMGRPHHVADHRCGIHLRRVGDVDDEKVLAGVIDGDVLVRLEEAQLADFLGTDAAGGKVGDAAGLKLNTDIRDVDAAREDGQADGMEGTNRRLDEVEDDVEVVDHQVENDVDVESTGAEDAEAMRLEKHGVVEDRPNGKDRGIEAFEVAGLKNTAMLPGGIDETSGLVDAGGDGFLNDEVDAGGEQGLADLEVERGWCTDGGGGEIHLVAGTSGQAFFDRGKDRRAPVGGGGTGAKQVGLDHGCETDGHTFLFEGAVDAQVIAAEYTGSTDEDAEMRGA